ncbi:amino acid adenylation domain-containing protein [Panacagrimonas sp.]|uniref:amino acid adenylation domain-containing protein n=1 Tax=Panacagrimonas sp. TaxID=2480088 RepID=UPI003B52DB5D
MQQQFEAQVLASPGAIALICGTVRLSYTELNLRANRIAHRLHATGCRRGAAVAVLLDRGPDLIASLLGVLKAGAYYVPIDLEYPGERIEFILGDCAPAALIAHTRSLAKFKAGNTAVIALDGSDATVASDANPVDTGTPDDPVYAIYTSGSTGKPKGALLYQRGAINLLQWYTRGFGMGPGTTFLMIASISFDLQQKSVFAPLLVGGKLVIPDSPAFDPAQIHALIAEHQVTHLNCAPSAFYALLEDADETYWRQLASLAQVFLGGELIHKPRLRPWLRQRWCKAQVINSYGPTECTDVQVYHRIAHEEFDHDGPIPIGRAVANCYLYVLDEQLQPVKIGEKGQLWIGGVCVGAGYINLPERTAESFRDNPFRPGEKMYASGDVVSWRPDGVLDCFGRLDHQVKVRGFRIELGEIESVLSRHPDVAECAVTAPADEQGERFLSAYVRLKCGARSDAADLGRFLGGQLPQHMLPATWTFLDSFPSTTSGKLDRLALPVPNRPTQSSKLVEGASLEERIADQWSSLLGGREVPTDARFFELGGTSLQAIQFVGRLGKQLGVAIPMVEFFRTPAVSGFSDYLNRAHRKAVDGWIGRSSSDAPTAARPTAAKAAPRGARAADVPIAIIGMAAQLPDAPDIDRFWNNLLDGKESLHLLSRDELKASGLPEAVWNTPDYVPVTAWMKDSECFDHKFFGYAPREADVIDPQQRVLLECAWAAMEHAGLALDRIDRKVGVYTGVAPNTYFSTGLVTHPEFRQFGLTHTVLASDKDYSATRVAFKLDLQGPAIGIQTACSSSGTAIHLACQALKAGDCSAAITGGACLPWHYRYGHEYVEDGPLTKDGHISVFDANGSGMALTGGVACVVLKRLDDAITDGDTIHAVIKASALNNDGSGKVAFTAPSVDGQVGVIREALERAGVSAETISYVEAHGTGTRLGDPIEVAALTQAYREHTDKTGFCRIGSAKPNVGHLDAASATVGLVKTALALSHRELPPSLNYRTPNPECAFDSSPFVVNAERRSWTCNSPLRAGVSSFGFGGTNFHAVLEEAPRRESSPAKRALQVLRLSAKTDDALKQAGANLADWFLRTPQMRLADVAYTLDLGRTRLDKRAFVVAKSGADAAAKLQAGGAISGATSHARPSLVFMFPGQGSQHVGMGAQLYASEMVFRSEVDHCAEILKPLLKLDLREVLYPKSGDREQATATLRATQLAQPAIFTISYATARLWQSWGFEATQMIGHSVGEFVAATLAGVFELEHALAILAERARLMQSMPAGGMLAVRLPEDEARQYTSAEVAVAGVNSPQLTVLSGPHGALEAVKQTLDAKGVGTTVLHTSHAFHSPMMEPVVAPFTEIVARQPRKAPALPFHSSLTGKPITAAQATDPSYWASQLRNAVRFAPGLLELAETRGRVFLECGPGQNLSTSSRQMLKAQHQAQVVSSLPHAGTENADDAEHLVQALGRLWLAGIEPDTARFYAGEVRMKLGLPTYPFARDRHFIEPLHALAPSATAAQSVASLEAVAVAPLGAPPAATESPEAQAMALAGKIFSDVTGIEVGAAEADKTFLELGFDSLLLTQVTAKLKTAFKVNLRFRQLLEEFPSLRALAAHLSPNLPQRAGAAAAAAAPPPDGAIVQTPAQAVDGKPAKAFGAGVRINKSKDDGLSPQQRKSLDALIARFIARTPNSKASAEKHRSYLADPRAVSGFRPLWKEIVYPIVTTRSDGPYLWDVDGNQYIDVINGFGTTLFGHKPEFVNQAIREQLEKGYEIGPIQDFIGEAAERFTRMVKLPRVAFCNTGSEAVSAAVRCARTVSGKDLVATFTGDYHGIHDEVIVRPGPNGRGLPAAGGIPNSHVANSLILDYGEPKSLEILRARADELAAIMIEPVQSRRPDLQPKEFMQACREIADLSGCAFIMDEVICGFRAAPGGAQEYFGVPADIGTYGKVFGGGMPIGAIAGIPKYMDALDGGHWQFGDDSVPEVGVTYFAGTFVRHPVNMAAVLATLRHLEANPNVQRDMNVRIGAFVERIRALLVELRAPLRVANFSSLYRFELTQDEAFGELFYYYLRERGLHSYDGRLSVMTTTHDDAILDRILGIYRDSITCMQRDGLMGMVGEPVVMGRAKPRSGSIWYSPPQPGARVGRDADGVPAWFVPDPQRPGHYLQLERP